VHGYAAAPGSGIHSNSNSKSGSDTDLQQLLVRETELVQSLRWSEPPQLQLQEQVRRLHAAMQQLKRLPADSLARTQFDVNCAYVQASRDAKCKEQTLQFLLTLIDDALGSTS
jgi:replication initiation and membrane attachment protein DnaB